MDKHRTIDVPEILYSHLHTNDKQNIKKVKKIYRRDYRKGK